MLLLFHHQTGTATAASLMHCIGVMVFSQGDLRHYIIFSPLKYLEKCITGVTLIAFMVLVQKSLNASVPPVFLSLAVCLILIRQYCQSVERTVAVTLSLPRFFSTGHVLRVSEALVLRAVCSNRGRIPAFCFSGRSGSYSHHDRHLFD